MQNELVAFFVGIFISLIPGLHINLIKYFSPSDEFIIIAAGSFLVFNILQIIIFFTSIPEEIAALPLIGKLAKRFSILTVILYHSFGALAGLLFAYFFYQNGSIKDFAILLKPYISIILLFSSLMLIIKSKSPFLFLKFFLLSGLVGFLTFSLVKNEPFLPLFSGLFSIPLLIKKWGDAHLEEKKSKINFTEFLSKSLLSSLLGSFLGFVAILLPSISSPSIITTIFLPTINGIHYISLLSSITSSQYLYAMYSWQEIKKARIGWAEGLKNINENLLIMSTLASCVLILFVARYLLNKKIIKVFGDFLKPLTIAYILTATLFFSGLNGLAAMIISSLIGELSIKSNVEKTSLLGCLIIPTMMIYFQF
jgi:putative membrane protein